MNDLGRPGDRHQGPPRRSVPWQKWLIGAVAGGILGGVFIFFGMPWPWISLFVLFGMMLFPLASMGD